MAIRRTSPESALGKMAGSVSRMFRRQKGGMVSPPSGMPGMGPMMKAKGMPLAGFAPGPKKAKKVKKAKKPVPNFGY